LSEDVKLKTKLLLIIFLTGFVISDFAMAADIKFGVIAPRGAVKAKKKWGEFMKYLGEKTGQKVKFVPVTPDKVQKVVNSGKVDFMLGNPVVTTILVEKEGVTPVATVKKKAGPQFSGVIISKKGSGIKTAQDLKGKKVMAFKFGTSAAAYVFQVNHLVKKGINPHKDFSSFREAKKQDDIVLSVNKGVIDAGFIKTGLIESMAKENKVKLSEFNIVDKQLDDFPFVHSTILYPEWYLSATKKASPAVTEKVKQAVLSLPADHPAAKKAKIKGFVDPLSLGEMKDTLKTLKLSPYDS